MGKDEKKLRVIETPEDRPPLDRWRADALLEPNRKLWGLARIAKVLGLSVDKTRELARDPRVPIYRPPGCRQYFAFLDELLGWLKSKPGQ